MSTLSRVERRFAYRLTLPIVIVLFCLLIFPLAYSVFISTQSSVGGLEELKFVGLKNYIELLRSKIFLNSIKNTVLFVVSTVIITIVLGFFVALLLNSIKKGVKIFRIIFILPLAIAPVVVGLTWGMMLNPIYGIVNHILDTLNLPVSGWATEIKTALITIILIDTWQWTPFIITILYAGMQMLPKESYEAGKMDGVNKFQEIIYITIPLLKPIFIIGLIFRFMDAFKSFDVIYAITKGGPGHATETLVVRAYLESLSFHRLEMGAVIGVFLLIVTFIITKISLKYMPK